jgi:hypothetical protein
MRVMAGLLPTMLALAGCGSTADSGAGAKPADVANVARQFDSDGGGLTKSQAQCVAEKATPKLSSKALAAARKSAKSSDISDLSKADQTVLFASVSACVTTAQLAQSLRKALASANDEVDGTCFSKAIVSAYPHSGDLMRDLNSTKSTEAQKALSKCATSTGDGTTTVPAAGATPAGGAPTTSSAGAGDDTAIASGILQQAMVAEMTKAGLSTAEANCVADKVVGDMSATDLAGLSASSSIPPAIESKVQAAVTACASAG